MMNYENHKISCYQSGDQIVVTLKEKGYDQIKRRFSFPAFYLYERSFICAGTAFCVPKDEGVEKQNGHS